MILLTTIIKQWRKKMKLSKLVGERVKEAPNGAVIKSHIYMLRAGYMKQVSTGIHTLLSPAQRSVLKIENIIREEMNKIDGQEVKFPVVMPRELWEDSGRYTSIGDEMVRFKDRFSHDMLLGMTHEEAAVHAAKNTVKSYDQLPFMIYQIQTKFRDEARSRAGLIRVREFTMKDAYSFHMNQADLEEYYKKAYDAYVRIYKRMGMKKVLAIASDTGMMGGSIAHEFQLLTPAGEDTIVCCDSCDYSANIEVADGGLDKEKREIKPLQEVFTGNASSIEEICEMLKVKASQTCKAVSYAVKGDSEKSVLIFIRGDLEVNEVKVKALIGADIVPNDLKDNAVLLAGNIGPVGLKTKEINIIYDRSLKNETDLVCGANKKEYHLTGLDIARDLGNVEFADVAKVKEGMVCPKCGKGKLILSKGIEVGNIFQLGTKYTKKMNMTVHDENGNDVYPIMGCYGIGVGRCLASVLEERSDDKGLVFPFSIAPWHVYLCPIRYDDEVVKAKADALYEEMKKAGVEVVIDDRNTSAGIKFADSELMGIPLRVVVSPRSLAEDNVELSYRESGEKEMVAYKDIISKVKEVIKSNI